MGARGAGALEAERPKPPEGIPMCAIGVDPTGGGEDDMVMAPRYDAWFASSSRRRARTCRRTSSARTPRAWWSRSAATTRPGDRHGRRLRRRRSSNHLTENDIECVGTRARPPPRAHARRQVRLHQHEERRLLGLREALDPDQPGGSRGRLPPDKRLMAGLCAPRYEVTSNGIKVEPKSKNEGGVKGVIERLGWSPNEADAVVMAVGRPAQGHARERLDRPRARTTAAACTAWRRRWCSATQQARRRR
jgi:hypothetical protein